MYAGVRFGIGYNYSDPDGLYDVLEHHIVMSDGTHAVYQAQGSGAFWQGEIFYFSYPGYYQWVKVYVIDRCGHKSNELVRYVTVYSYQPDDHYDDNY